MIACHDCQEGIYTKIYKAPGDDREFCKSCFDARFEYYETKIGKRDHIVVTADRFEVKV